MEITHKIIIAIHVPVINCSLQQQHEIINRATQTYVYSTIFPQDYIVLIFPHNLEEEKIIIEALNTENMHSELEGLQEILTKFEEMKNFTDSNKIVNKYNL